MARKFLQITSHLSRWRAYALAGLLSLSLNMPQQLMAQGRPALLEDHEGTVEVLHEDRHDGSRHIFFLTTAKERLELRFGSDHPALQTGDRIRARGRRSNNLLALDGSTSVQTLAAALPNTFGAQKTVVILVNFTDKATQPYTVATAQNVFNTASNFKLENSYNQTWLTGVSNSTSSADIIGWFTINQLSTECNSGTTASLADQAATAVGVNLAQYTRKVYAFPNNACTWWGLGSVGGNPSRSWINGSLQLRVVAHEMGHNLGLYHSHSWDCGAAVIGGTCTSSDYGDPFDTMGGSSMHYNAYQKERLGWLNYDVSPPLTTVQSDGVYWISPYETDTDDPKALKIFKNLDASGRPVHYYLEFRRPIGFDAGISSNTNLMNGVLVHMGTQSSGNTSYLLDMTPETASWSDPALTAGKSYSDPEAGVTFTVLSVDSTGANVSVTFTAGGTATCTRNHPSVTLSPASQMVGAGGSATYTVTVTNTDSSACTASSFNLSSVVPNGLSAAFASAALNLAPGASASTSVQVGASSSLVAGDYPFSVTGTSAADPSKQKSVGGVAKVITSLAVSLAADKPSYARTQSVVLTSTVSAGGAPLVNANVSFSITKANGQIVKGNALTGANGVATYRLRLNKKDPAGSYQATATAAMGPVSGNASTGFVVQ